ncbi:MAG: hypothetical protein K1X57_12215 [Gemmataceae bacterium]|nr:hypothetical protein [Gemmataceae bacterium]
MRYLAIAVFLLAPSLAKAQYGAGLYYPRGASFGFWTGPAFGYFPGAYGGFWSNGYSLYGPPVPTYGSIPGFFGGSDQKLSNFPDSRYLFPPYGWEPGGLNAYPVWGPWGGRGVVIPLNRPTRDVTMMAGPAVCEVQLPTDDAELFINGTKYESTGRHRRLIKDMPPRTGDTWEVEVRWAGPMSIGSARRSVTVRAGEVTSVDFTAPAGG